MNKMLVIGSSVFFTILASAAGAVEEHHPADVKPPPTSTSNQAQQSAQAGMQMQQMDAMMKKMQDMHEKIMTAKTPEERQTLMDEHWNLMQDGMTMMKNMNGKGSAGMMRGTDALEKRVDMMQMMMEMMMDRDPGGRPMAK